MLGEQCNMQGVDVKLEEPERRKRAIRGAEGTGVGLPLPTAHPQKISKVLM